MPTRHDKQSRAKPHGTRHRHGRPNALAPRGVGAGCDNAAFIGPAADRERFAAQFGITRFFHRAEEGVKIEVKDGGGHGRWDVGTHAVPLPYPESIDPIGFR